MSKITIDTYKPVGKVTTITSMSRFRFNELLQQIPTGDLHSKWKHLAGKEASLTKKQRTEFNQISAILNLHDTGQLSRVCNAAWDTLLVKQDALNNAFVELKQNQSEALKKFAPAVHKRMSHRKY